MEVTLFIFAVVYLLIILGGVTVALVWSRRRKLGFLKTTGVVLATLIVIYAIPFGDHTLGEIRKYQLCKEHGGTKIYQVVENVEGFLWETGRLREPYETFGYPFFEAHTAKGETYRYEKGPKGTLEEEQVTTPFALYFVRLLPDEEMGRHHAIGRFVIMDMRSKKILASHGTVYFRGGWLGLGGTSCSGPPSSKVGEELIRTVLKPRKVKG